MKVVGSCTLRDVVVKGPVENKDCKLAPEGKVFIFAPLEAAPPPTHTHTFGKDVWLKVLVVAGFESFNELSGFAGKVPFEGASGFTLLNEGKVGYGGVIAKGISAVGRNQVFIGFRGFRMGPSATVLGLVIMKNVEGLSFDAFGVSFTRNIVIKDTSGTVSIGPITKFGKARLIIKKLKGALSFGEIRLPPTIIANFEGRVFLDGLFDKYFTVRDVIGEVLVIASRTRPFTLLRTGPPSSDTSRDQVIVSNVVGPVKILQKSSLSCRSVAIPVASSSSETR